MYGERSLVCFPKNNILSDAKNTTGSNTHLTTVAFELLNLERSKGNWITLVVFMSILQLCVNYCTFAVLEQSNVFVCGMLEPIVAPPRVSSPETAGNRPACV